MTAPHLECIIVSVLMLSMLAVIGFLLIRMILLLLLIIIVLILILPPLLLLILIIDFIFLVSFFLFRSRAVHSENICNETFPQ